jgi:hypothetical protein
MPGSNSALLVASIAAASLVTDGSAATVAIGDEPAYVTRDQYTAVLHQARGAWQIQPADGQDVLIDTLSCGHGSVLPTGVWLLVADERGRVDLVAPSVTALPAGRADRVHLRSCDEAGAQDLAAPQLLIDLLAERSGAVFVHE